jgi:Zn-finger nucleic acid-binding protein
MSLQADQDHFHCEYCGNLYFPKPDDEGVAVLREAHVECPVCMVALFYAALRGERILYCTRCRGMLISMDEFPRILAQLRASGNGASTIVHPPDWDGLERDLHCPRCHELMDTHLYGGPGNVILDSCETCGLNWLDHGELARIALAPDPHYA